MSTHWRPIEGLKLTRAGDMWCGLGGAEGLAWGVVCTGGMICANKSWPGEWSGRGEELAWGVVCAQA